MCFCRTLFCLNVSNSCIFMSYVRKVVKDVSSQQPRNNVISFLQPYLLSYSEETFLHVFIMGGASQQIAFYTQEFTVFENDIQVRRSIRATTNKPKFMIVVPFSSSWKELCDPCLLDFFLGMIDSKSAVPIFWATRYNTNFQNSFLSLKVITFSYWFLLSWWHDIHVWQMSHQYENELTLYDFLVCFPRIDGL